ncbi:protein of unknown function [Micropruina glycogenica]|uniref:Uncharacterized protein n=1 Tax=Micropruina glycogenica TaxID=75385 RepID=A0A2N9JLC7_9ACTN|nr:protein of unknown function [Micropruina glycogenica]
MGTVPNSRHPPSRRKMGTVPNSRHPPSQRKGDSPVIPGLP